MTIEETYFFRIAIHPSWMGALIKPMTRGMLRLTSQIHGALSMTHHALLDKPTNETIPPSQVYHIFNHFNAPLSYKLTLLSSVETYFFHFICHGHILERDIS